jgi:hypothetical protein
MRYPYQTNSIYHHFESGASRARRSATKITVANRRFRFFSQQIRRETSNCSAGIPIRLAFNLFGLMFSPTMLVMFATADAKGRTRSGRMTFTSCCLTISARLIRLPARFCLAAGDLRLQLPRILERLLALIDFGRINLRFDPRVELFR